MHRLLLTGALGLFLTLVLLAQEPSFCGTQQGRSAWLRQYQAQPASFAKGGDTVLYVPLTIHITGTDDGVGYFRQEALYDALCKLNGDFAQANIQFFIEGDIRYHDNSNYYEHNSVLEGAAMMFAENVANTLNVYFVNDPAGNCGYNLPYAGIANSKGCSGESNATWAHEVGHALSLPHPFLGWEGGVSWDGSVQHDFADPAPEKVTYDYTYFQDTLILDTLIIDTAYVERVDGGNCAIAADGFCDTTPDYLAARWTCNTDGQSPNEQTDPLGEAFRSNGSLIMSYANDPCQTVFTPDQIAAMRAFLIAERGQWLYDQSPAAYLSGPSTLLGPESGEILPANQVLLSWEEVTNADGYLVEVSRLSSFVGGLTTELVTTETSLLVPDLVAGRTYYWRVRPFNRYDGCQGFAEVRTFITDEAVAATEPAQDFPWRVYPNPLPRATELVVELDLEEAFSGQWQLLDPLGRMLLEARLALPSGRRRLHLPTGNLPAGTYHLRLTDGRHQRTKIIVVQ